MAAIDTISPHINDYKVNSTKGVDQLSSNLPSTEISENSTSFLLENELQFHERVLSQSIANSTSGIALANIAQDGLLQQIDRLDKIKESLVQISDETNLEEKKLMQDQAYALLQEFDLIADTTTYEGESILKTSGDSDDDLSVVTEQEIVTFSKINTLAISDTLRGFLDQSLVNPASRDNMLKELDTSINKLASFSEQFEKGSNTLESIVKNKLTGVADSSKDNTSLPSIDYNNEVTNFSKTNLLTQLGYLMQTQANAHTNRTVEILK